MAVFHRRRDPFLTLRMPAAMSRTPHVSRIVATTCLAICAAGGAVVAGPRVSFDPESGGVRLIQKDELKGRVSSRFVVKAKGAAAVSRVSATVTGVLLQATARPDDAVRSKPIRLSYRLQGDHDALLCVTIGKQTATSNVPAWVWAVAARFAHHEATGAVTLIDHPSTQPERAFERRWRAANGRSTRLLWARYHPALDDTLAGFFLLAADAVIGDPEQMRGLPNGLKGFANDSGDAPPFDRVKSGRAARTLDAIISLKAKSGDCVMLNDVGETFTFTVSNGRLQITGAPAYRFARKDRTGAYRELTDLTRLCRKNRRLLRDASPLVHRTAGDFARLVAFFNYVGETNPEQLAAFVKTLKPVMKRIPQFQTPIAVPMRAR